jgi:hypothetical protein
MRLEKNDTLLIRWGIEILEVKVYTTKVVDKTSRIKVMLPKDITPKTIHMKNVLAINGVEF